MTKLTRLVLFVAVTALSACGSDPYASDVTSGSDFQLTVNQRGVSLVAHNANLKEVLQQISEKISPFTIMGDGNRLITDSFENLPPNKAIERLLSRNYGLVTDSDNSRVSLVFIASDQQPIREATDDSPRSISMDVPRGVAETTDTSSKRKEITFEEPLLIGSNEFKEVERSTQGSVSVVTLIAGSQEMIYDVPLGESIDSILERERPELVQNFQRYHEEISRLPQTDGTHKALADIDQFLGSLETNDVMVRRVQFEQGAEQ